MLHRLSRTVLSMTILRSSSTEVVDMINARFAAADDDNLAGNIITHQFGHCPSDAKCYLPCPVSTCTKNGDRMSTVLLSADVKDVNGNIPIYITGDAETDKGNPGGVIAKLDTDGLLCGWAADAGTEARQCDPLHGSETCVPGCGQVGTNAGPQWCEDRPNPGADCAWQPSDFAKLKEQIKIHAIDEQASSWYSELVFDDRSWSSHMPDTIEAFFVTSTTTDKDFTISQWQSFRQEYGKTSEEVPLLSLDLSNFETPFTDISSSVDSRSGVHNISSNGILSPKPDAADFVANLRR